MMIVGQTGTNQRALGRTAAIQSAATHLKKGLRSSKFPLFLFACAAINPESAY
jgi:hypothetical protein